LGRVVRAAARYTIYFQRGLPAIDVTVVSRGCFVDSHRYRSFAVENG
jgi:hypothetical protein